jgi:molecular chaperone HtpG
VANDWQHREALAKLLRSESSLIEAGKTTSLPEYVSRMPESQKEIYYLTAPNREAAEASPYYEVFREKKIEVLFLYAPQDEIVMEQLREFDKKRLVAAEKADLELEKESAGKLSEDEARLLANFIKERLGDRVNEVHTSKRLVSSPAVVVDSDTHMTSSMRRMMKIMSSREGGPSMDSKPNLEINPDHPMLMRLNAIRQSDAALAGEVAEQIFDNALVAAGLLEDPRAMLGRLNGLLEKLLNK